MNEYVPSKIKRLTGKYFQLRFPPLNYSPAQRQLSSCALTFSAAATSSPMHDKICT